MFVAQRFKLLLINSKYCTLTAHVFAAQCYASVAYVVMRCLCVCPLFVNSVKTNKHIYKIFTP